MGLDGVMKRIFEVIGTSNKYFVEIGYNTDQWSEGSNTCNLHMEHRWNGLLLDARFENASINLHKHFVTAQNIVDIFDKYEVPLEPDYVSIGNNKTPPQDGICSVLCLIKHVCGLFRY